MDRLYRLIASLKASFDRFASGSKSEIMRAISEIELVLTSLKSGFMRIVDAAKPWGLQLLVIVVLLTSLFCPWLCSIAYWLMTAGYSFSFSVGHLVLEHKFLSGLLLIACLTKSSKTFREKAYHLFRKLGGIICNLLGMAIRHETIFLASGVHEIRVDVGPRQPISVWVSFDDLDAIPICLGGVDKVGVQSGNNFFVIYADISSASRSVHWLAILD